MFRVARSALVALPLLGALVLIPGCEELPFDDERIAWRAAEVPFALSTSGDGLTFAAIADAKVRSTRPDKNYGAQTHLRVRQSETSYRSFVKLRVSGISGPVLSAELRLFVLDGSPDGGTVYGVSNAWSEETITWDNAPQLAGQPLGSLGAVKSGGVARIDVSSVVRGDGSYSFALSSASTNSAYYSSREGVQAPLLVLRVAGQEPGADAGPGALLDAGPGGDPDAGPAVEPDAGPAPDLALPAADQGVAAPLPDAPPTAGGGTGIWIRAAELAQRPTSGPAWQALLARANSACGTPNLADQDDATNVCVLAKALVFARTGQASYRAAVLSALGSIAAMGAYSGRALALGRELGAYVIAADLVRLPQADAALDSKFRAKIKALLTAPTSGGPGNLVECHEKRPNNWGTHCGGSRAAVAAYLGDKAELDRVAQVFRGWLGDRAAYAGFSYGDLAWQCDPAQPVGINPKGCTRSGHDIDGVIPDDQRRAGGFSWPPPQENYVYEGLQGALLQAVILERAGYGVLAAQDKALLRAFRWLHDVAAFPAAGDDTWQPHLVNRLYGASFPAKLPASPGKNVGFTDWTHGS